MAKFHLFFSEENIVYMPYECENPSLERVVVVLVIGQFCTHESQINGLNCSFLFLFFSSKTLEGFFLKNCSTKCTRAFIC